jgi:hypothetical protein
MVQMKTIVLTTAAAVFLTGCSDFTPKNVPAPAGGELDNVGFGTATAANISRQTRRSGGDRPINGKYAAVVFDEALTSAAPVATVSKTTLGGVGE